MVNSGKQDKHGFFSIIIKIGISVGLLGYLFHRVGYSGLLDVLIGIDPWWIFFGVLILTLSNISGMLQWYLLLNSGGISLSLRRTFSYYYTGLFFNNFLLGFLGGDLFRVYDITRHSGIKNVAISTVFIDRLIGLFTMCTLAFISVFFFLNLIQIRIVILPIVGGIIVFIFTAFFFYYKNFAKKFQGLGERFLPEMVQLRLREVYNAINYFKDHKNLLAKVLLISLFTQSLRIMTHYCAASSLGIELPFMVYFVLIPIISLVSMLPISIGGLGVREQSGVILFGFVSLAAPQAFAMQLLAYFINIVCSIPGGGSFIFRRHGRS